MFSQPFSQPSFFLRTPLCSCFLPFPGLGEPWSRGSCTCFLCVAEFQPGEGRGSLVLLPCRACWGVQQPQRGQGKPGRAAAPSLLQACSWKELLDPSVVRPVLKLEIPGQFCAPEQHLSADTNTLYSCCSISEQYLHLLKVALALFLAVY